MSMLPRLKPREFYDLVIEVAIVRPGPIQGNMVHPYLRRRSGEEKTIDLSRRAARGGAGAHACGVPLFQEQAMQHRHGRPPASPPARPTGCAGPWPPSAATAHPPLRQEVHRRHARQRLRARLRRCAASSRSRASASTASRSPMPRASRCWSMSRPGSNAIIPTSSPRALLNSQPMGFYAPAQIVRDARDHGVELRPVDVNHSVWDCTLEPAADGTRRASAPGISPGERPWQGGDRAEARGTARYALSVGRPSCSIAPG